MRQRRIQFHCSERTNTEKQLFMKGAFTKHYDGGVHVWSAALLQCIEILGNQSSYTFQLYIINLSFFRKTFIITSYVVMVTIIS